MQELPLYQTVPNAKPAENREKTEVNDWGVEFTVETSIPTLTAYEPEKPNGQAVIICPGGGYWGTAGDHEGRQVARALNEWGVTAYVLKYRVPDERTCVQPHLAPGQDVQQAIRLLRARKPAFEQIGVLGFSAGGHLAATAAVHFNTRFDTSAHDNSSLRPDFAILIYPVISFDSAFGHLGSRDKLLGSDPAPGLNTFFSLEQQVRSDCPPVFLVHAQDDDVVPVANSLRFFEACTRAGVRTELHVYPDGGHGFGMGKHAWMAVLRLWLWLEGGR